MIFDNPNPEIETDAIPTVPAAPILPDDPAPVPTPRKTPVTVEEPKNQQFTGRATQKEFDRIKAAITARKQEGKTYDIVRLCLDMMDFIEDDIFQTFITK